MQHCNSRYKKGVNFQGFSYTKRVWVVILFNKLKQFFNSTAYRVNCKCIMQICLCNLQKKNKTQSKTKKNKNPVANNTGKTVMKKKDPCAII